MATAAADIPQTRKTASARIVNKPPDLSGHLATL
jgi:hypothetical protein